MTVFEYIGGVVLTMVAGIAMSGIVWIAAYEAVRAALKDHDNDAATEQRVPDS